MSQTKAGRQMPDIWQNPNGTFSHHRDNKREWTDRGACETDLRFTEEWGEQIRAEDNPYFKPGFR